jgi:hypothetical protein
VVRLSFNPVRISRPRLTLTSASDFGDDLFRGGFPYERLRVGVPVFGPLGDRRGEVGDTGEHATAEPFVVQFLEPALDQVEP